MNDSFTSQNSPVYYQSPANQPAPATSNEPVVVDAPAAAPAPAMPGNPGDQTTQSPVQPVQNQFQPASPMDTSVVQPVSTTPPMTPAQPAESSAVAQSQTPIVQPVDETPAESTHQPTGEADAVIEKSSPEEVVQRLADRIKAYQAKQATAPAAAPVPTTPTAPAGEVVITPTTSSDDKIEINTSKPDVTATSQSATSGDVPQLDSETLDSQNIFELLGVMDGSEQEKDAFLDQLQQVIWEDFLENDVRLLLTKAEATELQALLEKDNQSEADRQEAAVLFLEKLIPDLEGIMLEKALDLKREMVFERIAGMRELHGGKPEVLAKITEAEVLFKQEKWQSGARVLNAVK